MWENYNNLQSSASTWLVRLQSLVRVLRKGLDTGLSKHQISNLFSSQALHIANISSLTDIEKFSGVRNGKIRADFYDDYQDIADPSALDHTQKNLLLLDDCFLGKQNKAEVYYARGRHINCDTIYIAQNYFRLPRHTIRDIYYPVPRRCKESQTYPR